MEKKIESFNQLLQAKGDELKEKAIRLIDAIDLPAPQPVGLTEKTPSHMPPISKICYGIAGISLVTALYTLKWPLGILTVVAVGGGYYFHRKKSKFIRRDAISSDNKATPPTCHQIASSSGNTLATSSFSPANEDELRVCLAAQMIEVCKQIKNEWELFMETTQQEMHQAIASLAGDEDRKQEIQAKIYFYESIDFPFATINQALQTRQIPRPPLDLAAESSEGGELGRIKTQLLHTFIDRIDQTVEKQQALYQSVGTALASSAS